MMLEMYTSCGGQLYGGLLFLLWLFGDFTETSELSGLSLLLMLLILTLLDQRYSFRAEVKNPHTVLQDLLRSWTLPNSIEVATTSMDIFSRALFLEGCYYVFSFLSFTRFWFMATSIPYVRLRKWELLSARGEGYIH